MKAIFIIATNTFREFIRDRILYGILVISAFFLLLSLILAELSYTEQTRITLDLGLAGLELSLIILSIFLGSTIIFREIEKQTVFTLLIRPITRGQFLIGKFLGLFCIIIVALCLLSLMLLGILLAMNWEFHVNFLAVIYGFLLESAVLISITMALGVIVRPNLTVPMAIGVLLIGKWTSTLSHFLQKDEFFKILSDILPYILPNFEKWDWKSEMIKTTGVLDIYNLNMAFFYALSWVFVLQAIAHLLFRRKDLA